MSNSSTTISDLDTQNVWFVVTFILGTLFYLSVALLTYPYARPFFPFWILLLLLCVPPLFPMLLFYLLLFAVCLTPPVQPQAPVVVLVTPRGVNQPVLRTRAAANRV